MCGAFLPDDMNDLTADTCKRVRDMGYSGIFTRFKSNNPHTTPRASAERVRKLLADENLKAEWVEVILRERELLIQKLVNYPFVIRLYPTDANFILVKTHDPRGIYQYLVDEKIIVRDRSSISLCEGCLRISIGSPLENAALIEALDGLI